MFSSMLELGELQHQVELRQQAELRALQSQINPHFLFNALNTISGLCLTNPNRAREIILNLAGYFRQTLSINEPFVTLEQEVSNVNNYLAITMARFENAIHVTWDLPENKQALLLPPLILQPLVENAVRHGGTTVDNRWIHIQVTQNARRAYIRVSDKGHGFPPEVLKKLEDPNDPSYSGLFNVRKRLHSIYASQCVFSVESSEQGSTVAFSIPLTAPQPA
jgi:two-component system sensor histidine kinase LytS